MIGSKAYSFLADPHVALKLPPPSLSVSARSHRHGVVKCRDSSFEIRVCTHRTCRKSGSLHTLDILQDLASPNITVQSCGCLGKAYVSCETFSNIFVQFVTNLNFVLRFISFVFFCIIFYDVCGVTVRGYIWSKM